MDQQASIIVPLTREQDALVHQVVQTGEYSDPVEVLREALAEWQWRRELTSSRLRALYEEGERSGDTVSIDFNQLMQEVREHVVRRTGTAG